MTTPLHSHTTANYEELDNQLRQSSPSPPPKYTANPQPNPRSTIPHLNFSLSSSPLPSPIYSPYLSHHLTPPFTLSSPYIHPPSPYLQSPSYQQTPLLTPGEHSSFLPFTLSTSPKHPTELSLKQKREKARRTRLIGIIGCVTLLLIALAVALAVVGVVIGWGKGGYCVKWDDGGSSGHCKGERSS